MQKQSIMLWTELGDPTPNSYVEALPQRDCVWRKDLQRSNQFSKVIRSQDWGPYMRKKRLQEHGHRAKAKRAGGERAHARAKGRSLRRNQTLPTLSFWTSSLQNSKERNFCCIIPSLWYLLWQSQQNIVNKRVKRC